MNVHYAVAKDGTRKGPTSINVLAARMLGTVVQFAEAMVRTKKDRTSTGVGAEVDPTYLKGRSPRSAPFCGTNFWYDGRHAT